VKQIYVIGEPYRKSARCQKVQRVCSVAVWISLIPLIWFMVGVKSDLPMILASVFLVVFVGGHIISETVDERRWKKTTRISEDEAQTWLRERFPVVAANTDKSGRRVVVMRRQNPGDEPVLLFSDTFGTDTPVRRAGSNFLMFKQAAAGFGRYRAQGGLIQTVTLTEPVLYLSASVAPPTIEATTAELMASRGQSAKVLARNLRVLVDAGESIG
jgi:hypothetical protein